MMVFRTVIAICIILNFAVISGCATSPLTRYPDFPGRRQNMPNVNILTDIIIVNDNRKIDRIDMVDSKELGNLLLQIFTDRLNQKGYTVGERSLSSIGLTLNPNVKYKVIGTVEDRGLDVDTLPTGFPPFYLDSVFEQNSEMKRKLTSLLISLNGYVKKEGEANKTIPEATTLGIGAEGDMLLVILAGGHRVPMGKLIAAAALGTIVTLALTGILASSSVERTSVLAAGMIGVASGVRPSSMTMRAYILDTRNGEVIWDNRAGFTRRYSVSKDSLKTMAESIIKGLP